MKSALNKRKSAQKSAFDRDRKIIWKRNGLLDYDVTRSENFIILFIIVHQPFDAV